VQPAEETIGDLSRQLAGLLERIAGDLEKGKETAAEAAGGWLARARELDGEMHRVDRSLAEAEESLRLNPRARSLPNAGITLRSGLETLEHSAVTSRGIARSIGEACRITAGIPLHDAEIRSCLAAILRELAAAIATIGPRVRAGIAAPANGAPSRDQIAPGLAQHLSQAWQLQHHLAELLHDSATPGLPGWPLRGELLIHLDRLRNELLAEHPIVPRNTCRAAAPGITGYAPDGRPPAAAGDPPRNNHHTDRGQPARTAGRRRRRQPGPPGSRAPDHTRSGTRHGPAPAPGSAWLIRETRKPATRPGPPSAGLSRHEPQQA